jgi:hypothetical protein
VVEGRRIEKFQSGVITQIADVGRAKPGNLQLCDPSHLHPRQAMTLLAEGREGVFGAGAGPGARRWRCDYGSRCGSFADSGRGRWLLWRKLVRAADTQR